MKPQQRSGGPSQSPWMMGLRCGVGLSLLAATTYGYAAFLPWAVEWPELSAEPPRTTSDSSTYNPGQVSSTSHPCPTTTTPRTVPCLSVQASPRGKGN